MDRSKLFFFILIAAAVVLLVAGIIYIIGTLVISGMPGIGPSVPKVTKSNLTTKEIPYTKQIISKPIDYDFKI